MPATAELRRSVAQLAALADRDLAPVWASVSSANAAKAALLDTLPVLVDTYGSGAALVAADWYDTAREEAGARGSFQAIPADTAGSGADVLARWGIEPLFAADADWAAAKVLISGGLQRRIANAARDTITVSAVADPAARGWKRVGIGGCEFCRMLIGRGAVYTEATADFQSHDRCNCAAVPEFR